MNLSIPITLRGRHVTLELVRSGLAELLCPFGSNTSICNYQLGCDPAELDEAIEREGVLVSVGLSAYYRVSDARGASLSEGAHIKMDFRSPGEIGFHGGMARLNEHRSAAWIEAMCMPMAYFFAHGCNLAVTTVRADNQRALHFLDAIGFKLQRACRFLKSGRHSVQDDQIFLTNDRTRLLASPVVRRYLSPSFLSEGQFVFGPARLSSDDPAIQLDESTEDEIRDMVRLASANGFRLVDPADDLNDLLASVPHDLIVALIPEADGAALTTAQLWEFLRVNYRISSNRYFVLFDASGRCSALLSAFLGTGMRYTVSLRASVGKDFAARRHFVETMRDRLLPQVLQRMRPDRIQALQHVDDRWTLEAWRAVGLTDEGVDSRCSLWYLSLSD